LADNFRAAAAAAGLTPAERKEMEAFNKTLSVHRELSNLPQRTAQQAYALKSPEQQAALKRVAGEEDPVTKPQRGWLGTAWHYATAPIVEPVKLGLKGLTEVSDFMTRAYRTGAIAVMEGKNIGDAWTTANDKGDKVFNPGRIENATAKFGNDRMQVAMRVAAGEKLSAIAASGTDAQKQIAAMAAQNKDDLFQDALDAAQAAKYSPGRQIANLVTPEQIEGSGFFYRAVSGTFDAAYRIFADPLIIAGKAKRLVDISRYSLDVVVGGNKVAEVFARPQVQNFWNQYGAELAAYKKALDEGATKTAVEIKKRLVTLAPEFGDPVIRSFINTAEDAVPITDALTAKGFFENAKQLEEMLKGQIGRKRVMIPRLDLARKTRITTVTTANRVFNLDKIGPRFVDDLYFGGASTDDGIAKAVIDGQETIVTTVKANRNAKGTARFSMAQVQYRIDRFKAKFSQVPFFEDDLFDVTSKDSAALVYRYARLVLPKNESRLIAQAFDNSEVGRKKEIFYGLQSTIADIRGLNVTKEGKAIADQLKSSPKREFAITDPRTGYNPAALPDGEQVGLILSDNSDFLTTLSVRDIDRAASRSGLIQQIAGLAHSNWVEKMTTGWSFLTLAGPRYAIRNATEDLMVHLAIGESPFGLLKARGLSTRLRTARQVEEGLTTLGKAAEDPLGGVIRFVNRKEAKHYTQAIAAAQGDVVKIRQITAEALNEGKLARFYDQTGLGKFTADDRKYLQEQILFGDLDNALMDVVEGSKNSFTGVDTYTRTINFARKNNVRTAELGMNLPKGKFARAKGAKAYTTMAPLANEATQVAWAMRIGYYANDRLGGIAVANLTDDADETQIAIGKIAAWLNDPKNAKEVAAFRMGERGISNEEHAKRIYDAAKQLFVKRDGSLNQDLLSKVRTLDPETGEYRITGKLGLDDLPKNIDDAPDYIVGPQLVPVTDTGNYTTSIMEWGWDWLGEANARLSREPMVLSEIIKMRKQFDESGFEKAFIASYQRGITDPAALAKAEFNARTKLAEIVEDRARLQTLAYVDNPAIQSQLAFSIRNFARFYRATEDFYRRMYRVVRYNPEAIVKASLTYEGVTHSGWVQQDDQGEPYFIYPGTQYVYKAVQAAMQALGVPAEFKTPFPVEFGAKLKMITPSLNPESAVPTLAGPLSGFSIKVASNLVGIFNPGAADRITTTLLGKYAEDQPMVSSFLPAHVNRIYSAMNQDERDGQYASAMRKAMTYLEAGGHGLVQKYETVDGQEVPIPFSAAELEDYRVRLKNTTLGILGMRVVYGFTAPATAQVQLKSEMADWVRDNGEASFKQTWYGLLDKYGDYDTAMTEWVKRYPDQMPFTVSESDRSTVAYFRYAQESGDFVDGNQELFKSYPQGAAFLIPHKAGYSWDAYKTMTDMGLRKNKTVADFMREVQTAADMQTYYEKKNAYEENLKSVGTDFERSQLRKEFTDWATVFKAGRPLVQEELAQGGAKAIERMKALNDLQKMLDEKAAYKAAPETANKLREMMDLYNSYKATKDQFEGIGGSQFLVNMNKEETIIKMRKLSEFNENTQSAYNVLFGRLLGD
jgi:hypothetical protein